VNEFLEYARHGWKLCAIGAGSKGPLYEDWNEPAKIEEVTEAAEGLNGAGLCHALSGTCAIDIDSIPSARAWLAERGVDLDGLLEAPNAVRISSGKSNRAKLVYAMKRPLATIQPRGVGIEFRCATKAGKSVQDVLPPTVHPETHRPYEWLYGDGVLDWRTLPPIPAGLLAAWRQTLSDEPQRPDVAEPKTNGKHEPTSASNARIELARLEKIIFSKRDPNAEYPEWLKVGMQLHHEGAGSQEAFDIWCRWSRGVTRIPYPGDDLLEAHWRSFSSDPGKHVTTGGELLQEEVAEADEFPVITEDEAAPPADSTAAKENEAKQLTRNEAIAKLEARVVYVYNAEKYFDVERQKVIGSDNALKHMFTPMMPRRKGGRLDPVKLLMESTTKRYFDSVGFHPGEGVLYTEDGDKYANMYRNKLPEPLEPTKHELDRINWIFDRIDDPIFKDWLLKFYAHVVQYPGVKIKSAPLIWSPTTGNGKTTILRMVPSLLVGRQYSREVNCSLLADTFNGYLQSAWHVNLVEFRAGTRGERSSNTSLLKQWITEDIVPVRPMHQTAYMMPNHFFITASGNDDDAAAIDNEDRRWGIHEMRAPQMTEDEVNWIYHQFLLKPRAAGVLRHYFLNMPLGRFSASGKAPETEARRQMISASVASDFELLQTAYEERSGVFERDVVLTQEVKEYVHKHSPMKPSAHRIGRLLCRPPFNGKAIQFSVGKRSFRANVLFNQHIWEHAKGSDILAHIQGEDIDILS
jgi:Bifunctional DNA primase/polymerase, N-terminal/Family of unknown function (DUF5906)/Primase C terminal 2 (PriCT-2)